MHKFKSALGAHATRRDVLFGSSAFLMIPHVAWAERTAVVDLRLADNLVGFHGSKIRMFLAENLEITPSHDIARPQFHFVRVTRGTVAALFSSPRAEKLVFPGEMFFPGKMFTPKAAFFDGMKISKVKKGGKISDLQKERLATTALKAFGERSGVMIVTSWDDMASSDASSTLYLYS